MKTYEVKATIVEVRADPIEGPTTGLYRAFVPGQPWSLFAIGDGYPGSQVWVPGAWPPGTTATITATIDAGS